MWENTLVLGKKLCRCPLLGFRFRVIIEINVKKETDTLSLDCMLNIIDTGWV